MIMSPPLIPVYLRNLSNLSVSDLGGLVVGRASYGRLPDGGAGRGHRLSAELLLLPRSYGTKRDSDSPHWGQRVPELGHLHRRLDPVPSAASSQVTNAMG